MLGAPFSLTTLLGADNVTLHVFPNPNKDLSRFTTWINAIGGEVLSMDQNTVFDNRRVCHIHFESCYHTRSRRLSPNAVPTLHLSGASVLTRPQPLADITNAVRNHPPILQYNPSFGQPTTSASARDVITPEVTLQTSPSTSRGHYTRNPLKYFSPEIMALGNKIKRLQKAKITAAAKLKKALQLSENITFKKTIEKFTAAAVIFTMLQFREVGKQKMGRRFKKEEKVMALALYKQGPRAYRWMRNFFVLPSPLTLSRMISCASLKPGINENIFKQLKKKTRKMNTLEKLCILLFDEIALTPHFDYNQRRDSITGFVNNGTNIKNKIGDHALVFMLRGIHKNYKQPLVYSFCAMTTPKEELVMQIKNVIRKLKSIGFIVIATVLRPRSY